MRAGGLGWGMAMKWKHKTAVSRAKAKERSDLRRRLQGAGIGLEHPQMTGGSSWDTSFWVYSRRRPRGGSVPRGFQSRGRSYRGLLKPVRTFRMV